VAIMPYVKTRCFVSGVIVDIKTRESLNKFSFWNGKDLKVYHKTFIHSLLSEEEVDILTSL
jgi:hypothetical protein